MTGKPPNFPLAERLYFLNAVRYVARVIPISGPLMLLGTPLVLAWVGPDFLGSVIVLQLLAFTVIVRVGNATAATLLKGAGEHRLRTVLDCFVQGDWD